MTTTPWLLTGDFPSISRSRLWSAVAKGGTTAATAFAGRTARMKHTPTEHHTLTAHESPPASPRATNPSKAVAPMQGLRLASARPHSKFAPAHSQQTMECGREGRNDRSYRFRRPDGVRASISPPNTTPPHGARKPPVPPRATNPSKAVAPMQGLRLASARPHSKFTPSAFAAAYGVRSRREERPQLPLSQAGRLARLHFPSEHHTLTAHESPLSLQEHKPLESGSSDARPAPRICATALPIYSVRVRVSLLPRGLRRHVHSRHLAGIHRPWLRHWRGAQIHDSGARP